MNYRLRKLNCVNFSRRTRRLRRVAEEVQTGVRERLPWRYFCHLSLMDTVPDATTLIKLNQRFGEERMTELNRLPSALPLSARFRELTH